MAQLCPALKKYDFNTKNAFALLGKIMSCVPIRRVPAQCWLLLTHSAGDIW